ncbi:hypothetical protein FBU31_001348, partial [Coemansia sp. 'formosensis']
QLPALDAPCPEPAAVEPLPPPLPAPPLSAEEPKAKDKGGDVMHSAPPPAKGAAPKQAPVAESGSSSPRNAKKATEPGPRKPNAAGEPSRLAENWRAGPAPKPPPAPQPAAPTQAAASSEPAVPANAPRRRSTGTAAKAPAQQDKPERPAPKPSAAATATSWRAEPNRTKPAVEATNASEEDAGSKRALTQGVVGDPPPNGRAAYPAGSSASQINGLLHVMPLSPALLPQTMLAELMDEGASQAPMRDALPVMPEAAAPAQGRFGVPSSSLFNVEGSPLMGSYNAPVRPAFGHADPGLFSWQGSHMGFHDMRARQEYLHASSAAAAAEPRWASNELSQGAPFSSFSAAAALWMDPAHEARAVESQDSGSACGSGASSGSRGHRAPRPIGTRSTGPGNGQRNTRSRQGMQYGAPSPVPGQHPLFVPATHMHQSWLPHYSAMQPAYAAGGARFGGGVSPRHSPQMTAAPQPPAVGPPFMVAHSMDHQQMLQMPAHQMPQGGRANGAFASAPPQYMPEAFRPSPPMYQYGYVGGAQPPPKQGKAGPPPPTTSMAPHYHGYPPQMPMPSHTGSAPHMAFMPMYIPGDPNSNAYYYGQAFGGPPPLGQYRPMPGYPSASMEAQKPVAEPLATKQAEKLLGISRSSSNSTRGPSKPAEPLAAPTEAAVPRTTSMAPPPPPPPQAKGERTRQRGSGRRNERKPAKENAEASAMPRERPQRPDAKRIPQQPVVPKPDDKARKQAVPLPRTANASAPGEDGKAAAGDQGPGGEKPARRNRGNRPGRGGAKKGNVPTAGAKVG